MPEPEPEPRCALPERSLGFYEAQACLWFQDASILRIAAVGPARLLPITAVRPALLSEGVWFIQVSAGRDFIVLPTSNGADVMLKVSALCRIYKRE